MASTIITEITDFVAEGSDYLLTAQLVGPDLVTPVEPAAIATILATLRDIDLGTLVFEDRAVTSGLTTGGAFSTALTATDTASSSGLRFQRRLLTLKMTQTNGKKRNQAIKFTIENLVDIA